MKEWHVSAEVLERFATEAPMLDDVAAASTEMHLGTCSQCQADFAELFPSSELDVLWAEIADEIDRSSLGVQERLARRLGTDSASFRLIAATPALQLAALGAVAGVVALMVLASRYAEASGIYFTFAPLVPTALIALAFMPGIDPAGEAGLATPMFDFSLVMRRALAIELVALAVLAAGSAFLPISGLSAVAWLVPSLALSLATMAAGARWPATDAALVISGLWIGAVFLATVAVPGIDVVDTAVFARSGQMILTLIAVGAVAVIVTNRHTLFQEVGR